MKLKIKKLDFSTGRPVCILNKNTAKKLKVPIGSRVLITKKSKTIIAINISINILHVA